MEKELKIQIVGDTKKFNDSIKKLKEWTWKLHDDLSNMDKWVRTNKIEKVNKEIKKVIWTSKDLKSKISESHKLRLNVDNYEQKIKQSKRLLRWLDSKTNKALKIRLDISKFKSNLAEAKRELRNFTQTWNKKLSKFSKWLRWAWNFWAWMIWAVWIWALVTWPEDFMKQLGWLRTKEWKQKYTASEVRQVTSDIDVAAASAWIDKNLYRQSYLTALKQWWGQIWFKNYWDEIIKNLAISTRKWYDSWEILKASLKTQQEFWWSLNDIVSEITWLVATWLDVKKELPDLFSEYAPLLKESWFKDRAEMYALLKKWMELNLFTLDKAPDLIKEQALTFTNIFNKWKKWDYSKLNKIFGPEFTQITEDFKSWKIDAKSLWEEIATRSEKLSKWDRTKFLMQIYKTQWEDLWFWTATKLRKSTKVKDPAKFKEELRKSAEWEIKFYSELSNRTVTWILDKSTAWLSSQISVVTWSLWKLADYIVGYVKWDDLSLKTDSQKRKENKANWWTQIINNYNWTQTIKEKNKLAAKEKFIKSNNK